MYLLTKDKKIRSRYERLLLVVAFLTSFAVMAEVSGDFCEDRLAAITYFSYQEGHAEGCWIWMMSF